MNINNSMRKLNGTGRMLFCLFLSPLTLQAQQQTIPQRGFHPAGSYALTDLETINVGNGNLMLRIPTVSLPDGPGGAAGARVDLLYNSKLWDSYLWQYPCDPDIPYCDDNTEIVASPDGGWQYAFKYELRVDNRRDHYHDPDGAMICGSGEEFIIKLEMVFPDGGVHEFRPRGLVDDGSGYFPFAPDGQRVGGCGSNITSPMTYYSVDGTYMKLVIDHDGDGLWNNNPWTLYLPDGGRVTGGNAPQRIYDRNNNWVEFRNTGDGGDLRTEIVDQLGRSLIVHYGGSSGRDYVDGWGTNGEQVRWTIDWTSTSIDKVYDPGECHYACFPIPPWSLYVGLPVIHQISLPTQAGGLAYTFDYNSTAASPGWGELSYLRLPSGAEATYQYRNDGLDDLSWANVLDNIATRKDLTYPREYDGEAIPVTETWLYSDSGRTFDPFIITSPDGGVVKEYQPWLSPRRLSLKTEHADGRVVERVWRENLAVAGGSANPYVKTEFTSLKDPLGNLVKTAVKDFSYDKNGNLTGLAEYDWVDYSAVPRDGQGRPTGVPGSAPLKRTTIQTYYNPTPDASWTGDHVNAYYHTNSQSLRRARESIEVRKENGQTLSRAEFFYDNAASTGNLTQEKRWDSTKGALTQPLGADNSISVSHQYSASGSGNRIMTTDGRNIQTQFVYGPINGYSDLYVTQTQTAYQTAVQRTTNFEYDFYTGRVTLQTDADNSVSTRTSYDVFGRPVLTQEADGTTIERRTTLEYSDSARRVITRSDLNTTGDNQLVKVEHYDPMGRLRLSRQLENAATQSAYDESTGTKVQTRYAQAAPYSYELVSNPYRATVSGGTGGEATMGWVRTKRNGGGRVIEVQTFAGAGLPAPWGSNAASTGAVVSAYSADATTVTDQAGKARQSARDGLGRLAEVIEDPLGYGYSTTYNYDALDNLTLVQQGAQARTFEYDSLGRLGSATNPETEYRPVRYEHDGNGNVTQRTDARGVVTTYQYDPLNRLTARNYNDTPRTPAVAFVYDAPGVANSKGRLTSVVTTGVSTYTYDGYDKLGRVMQSTQTTAPTAAKTMQYTYNLAGGLVSEKYPEGRTVTTAYDTSGRVSQVSSGGTPYSSSLHYAAHGAVEYAQLGNGRWEHTAFNSRLQPLEIGLGVVDFTDSSLLRLTYGYGAATNNGNVLSQEIVTPGGTWTQSYTYDYANRLQTAGESGWVQTYSYDIYGNRAVTEGYRPNGVLTPQSPSDFSASTNRLYAAQYDYAGNQTVDAAGRTYGYDAENLQRSFNGTAADYSYDGEGRRVKKTDASGTTVFVYDAQARLVAEYGNQAPISGGRKYLTQDHLGSLRVATDESGAVFTRHDYLPFGEELPGAVSGDPRYGAAGYVVGDDIRQRFSGKERDAESGLDYFGFRYYSSPQGRWTSPDEPFADQHPEDPQSWNMYAYVRNNPLKNTDPNGRDCTNGLSNCGSFVIGVLQSAVNVLPDTINLPNRLVNLAISPFTDYRLKDVVPRLEPTNVDMQEGQNAGTAGMLMLGVGELVAAKAGAVEELGAAEGSAPFGPKLGEAGGPGAGKRFSPSVMNAVRTESNDTCVFCGTQTERTPGPNQSNIDHAIPKSRNGNNTLNNAQNTCRTCNLEKGTQTTQEYLKTRQTTCTTTPDGKTVCK